MGFTPGTAGSLTATLNDAKSQSGGAVVFMLSNAVFENADTQAQHAQFGSVTGTWQCYSTDGTHEPSRVHKVVNAGQLTVASRSAAGGCKTVGATLITTAYCLLPNDTAGQTQTLFLPETVEGRRPDL